MKVRGLGRARKLALRLSHRWIHKAVILLYHRVEHLPVDPQCLAVKPQHFQQHLDIISRNYYPISLENLVTTIQTGQIPNRAVVVTFDDGYADNLFQAKPLLEQYSIPATVYITAGQVAPAQEFYWDELERILLEGNILPQTLELELNSKICQWTLGETANYSPETSMQYAAWNVQQVTYPTARQQIYRELCDILRPLANQQQQVILQKLRRWANLPLKIRSTHRQMTEDEITTLIRDRLIQVGAHTVTHPRLSSCTAELQQTEIYGSKTRLEGILGQPVHAFSYPYGSSGDYNSLSVQNVRSAGFKSACINNGEIVGSGVGIYELPRVLVRDWDGDQFAKFLSKLFGD